MQDKLKPVRVSFKEDEAELAKFINDHSSPSAFLKDLAIEEMRRKNVQKMESQQEMPTFGLFDGM